MNYKFQELMTEDNLLDGYDFPKEPVAHDYGIWSKWTRFLV